MKILTPYYTHDQNLTVYRDDAFEVMAAMASGSVDAIITDPPYWTLDKWRAIGTTTRLMSSGWFPTLGPDKLLLAMKEFYRLLPKPGHVWLMCDGETLGFVLQFLRESLEFDYFKPFPVVKMIASGASPKQGTGYHGRAAHEYVVLCEKGRRRFATDIVGGGAFEDHKERVRYLDENWPDVFMIPWTGATETRTLTPDRKAYPTAKPVALFRRLVELSTTAGEVVLDPFAGSGACTYATWEAGRKAIAIDVEERAVKTIVARWRESAMPSLFALQEMA